MTVQPDIYSSQLSPDILLSQSLFLLSSCRHNVSASLSFCEISCQTNNTIRAWVRFTQEEKQTFISGYVWQTGTSYEQKEAGFIFWNLMSIFCNYTPFLSANGYKLTFQGIDCYFVCHVQLTSSYSLVFFIIVLQSLH